MRYEKIQNLEGKEFRRLTGVKPETFKKMVEILSINYAEKRKRGGHKSKLLVEDMLLIALEYWRENRTYFHIAKGYEIHETTAIRIVRWVEDTLISDGTFSLPGKKAFLDNNLKFEIIAIDATETPIQRPKRGKNCGTQEKRNNTQ